MEGQASPFYQASLTWQDYITFVLMETGHVSEAAIQNARDGTVWASTNNFRLSPMEVKMIDEGFREDHRLRLEGIVIGGRHFTLSRISERRVMVGRDSTTGAGCIIYRCHQCLVVAIYGETQHPGQCYSIVTQLGDYLYECGL